MSAKTGSKRDVIIMGGGPAGSTCASILAREGRNVIVIEKEKFPRHHIGESLIPDTYWVFERMGMLDKMKKSAFVKKFGVAFATPAGKDSKPFYFFETDHHESSVTWQVTRADFDLMLLDHAAEQGAETRQETRVKEVLFEGKKAVGVAIINKDGGEEEIRADVIVDATGQSAMLSNRMGWRVRDPNLRKAAVYSYWKGAHREAGIDGGSTLVLKTPEGNGWFWYIPLADGVTSMGVVADADYLMKDRGRDFQKILDEEIEKCEAAKRRVKDATQCDKVYTQSDYSYRSTQMAGDGFVLIGDAYGFLDPIYSSGVLLALKSGDFAATAIQEAFAANDFSAARLGVFEPQLRKGIESMRKLVYAYYTEDFRFSNFLMKYPQYRCNLIDLLVGDLFKEGVDDIYGPMSEFFTPPEPIGAEPKPAAARAGA